MTTQHSKNHPSEQQHIPPGQNPQAQQNRAAERVSQPLRKTDAGFLSVLRHYSVPAGVDADDRFEDDRAKIAWDAFRVGSEGVPLEQLPGKSRE